MKRILIYIIFISLALSSFALEPTKWNQRYQAYIDKYRDLAICEMLQHNIPASITLAQGLIESSAGESELSTKGNNHFGIKCHDWTGPTMNRDDDKLGECFRVYPSAYESYEDHSRFLERPRYSRLFSLKRTDYVGWANGLKACGYATNPRYAQMLIDVIECYNLSSLDRATSYDEANIPRGKDNLAYNNRHNKQTRLVNAHQVMMNNRDYYVIARKGDSFRSIADEFGVSYRKIAKYNERDKHDVLHNGDIVYLEKKRTKADKVYRNHPHTVRQGESMYSIAQMYGIRLKSLYKMNGLTPDYSLSVGDRLRIY